MIASMRLLRTRARQVSASSSPAGMRGPGAHAISARQSRSAPAMSGRSARPAVRAGTRSPPWLRRSASDWRRGLHGCLVVVPLRQVLDAEVPHVREPEPEVDHLDVVREESVSRLNVDAMLKPALSKSCLFVGRIFPALLAWSQLGGNARDGANCDAARGCWRMTRAVKTNTAPAANDMLRGRFLRQDLGGNRL
jgi:hypothetical protein